MNGRSRTIAVPMFAIACAAAIAVPAFGADYTKHSELRVEAAGSSLEPGRVFSNGSIRTTNSNACGSTNSDHEQLAGANAMGIVGHAARVNDGLVPFRTSDTFDFGLIVCQIEEFVGFGNDYWLYNVNHVSGTVGGDQRPVGRRDEVLWYFVRCTESVNFQCVAGENYGRELGLTAPARAEPGGVTVTAFAYNASGERKPEAGIEVSSSDGTSAVTGPDGKATLVLTDSTHLRATREREGDIPSEPLEVCVKADLSECPERRGENFVGTNRSDRIVGTDGADTIRPRDERDVGLADG